MPPRLIDIQDETWEVAPSGRVTQYTRDELGLLFSRRGATPETRVVRYAPLGSRFSEDSLAELSDRELRELWTRSQPAWTAPETGYRR
jgi:YD repeat-containing protein